MTKIIRLLRLRCKAEDVMLRSHLIPLIMKNPNHPSNVNMVDRFLQTILLIVVFLSSSTGYSQSPNTEDWQLLKESEGVNVYYLISQCDARLVLHLKIENNNQAERTIAWVASIKRDNVDEWVVPSTMVPKRIGVGAHISGDCDQASPELTIPLADASELNNLSLYLNVQS
jgi:hypothetical protein